jgi:hypothetical protein
MGAAPFKIPKSFGAAADLYYSTREKRLAIEREAKALQEQETAIKDHIIENLPKTDGGATGKLCRVLVVTKPVAQVEDWDKFYTYIAKNRTKGSFALLNRAVNQSSVKELWESGKQVPGVKPFNAVTLSVSKL